MFNAKYILGQWGVCEIFKVGLQTSLLTMALTIYIVSILLENTMVILARNNYTFKHDGSQTMQVMVDGYSLGFLKHLKLPSTLIEKMTPDIFIP